MARRRIGILTGGGDVPGLNVAIKAVVNRAVDREIEIVGLRRGWFGPMAIDPDDPTTFEKATMKLDRNSVRRIDRTGGTILHSSRTNPSNMKPEDVPDYVREEDQFLKEDGKVDCTRHVLRALDAIGIEAMISIGGDDTLSYAARQSNFI